MNDGKSKTKKSTNTTEVIVPKLIKMPNGYGICPASAPESEQNKFTPMALATVLTGTSGITPTSMVEATELVAHWAGKGRSWPHPHITENRAINGFYFNVFPLFAQMKSEMERKWPLVSEYISKLENSNLWKTWIDDPENDQKRALIVDELVRVFGQFVVIQPSNKPLPDPLSTFLSVLKPATSSSNSTNMNEQKVHKAVYINSLDRKYDEKVVRINAVTFPLSRYGKHQHTIEFAQPVTESAAIAAAENFLEQKPSEATLAKIKSDLYPGTDLSKIKSYTDCLSSCIFLEEIRQQSPGHIVLICGS